MSQLPPLDSRRRLLYLFDRASAGDGIRLVSDSPIGPVCQVLYEERQGQFLCHKNKEAPREWVARIVKTR